MVHLPPATPGTLRERFVADMTVRGFTDQTRKDYIRTVAGFAAFLERSPSTATAADIRRFQIQQSERGMNAPAMNSAVAALRFFFNHTADRPDLARKLLRLRYPRKLPTVLSPDEAARLIAATTCLKRRAAGLVAGRRRQGVMRLAGRLFLARHAPGQIAALLRSTMPLAPCAAKGGPDVPDQCRSDPARGKRPPQTRVGTQSGRMVPPLPWPLRHRPNLKSP